MSPDQKRDYGENYNDNANAGNNIEILISDYTEPAQIEVGHVGNFVGDLFTGQGLIGGFFGQVYPELAAIPTARHEAACASGSIAILSAMRDIEAGHYDMACALGLELMRMGVTTTKWVKSGTLTLTPVL